MDEPARLQTSRKAYHSHVTRILNKVEDTLANEIDELAITYLKTAVTQLEKKREQIIKVDEQIVNLVQTKDDLEAAILDAEELQDLILKKINELNKRVETLSRPATVPVLAQVPDKDPDDHGVTSQEEPGDQPVPKDTQDSVSAAIITTSNITITTDTPVVCTSYIAASNTIPTT